MGVGDRELGRTFEKLKACSISKIEATRLFVSRPRDGSLLQELIQMAQWFLKNVKLSWLSNR